MQSQQYQHSLATKLWCLGKQLVLACCETGSFMQDVQDQCGMHWTAFWCATTMDVYLQLWNKIRKLRSHCLLLQAVQVTLHKNEALDIFCHLLSADTFGTHCDGVLPAVAVRVCWRMAIRRGDSSLSTGMNGRQCSIHTGAP